MFESLTSTVDKAILSIAAKSYRAESINIHPLTEEDVSAVAGNEAFSFIDNISDGVKELPSGTPQTETTKIVRSIIELNTKLDNVTYCPVSLIGKNDRGGYVFNVKISGSIEDVVDYLDLLECLATATENDDIMIAIDSPGGYIHTGVFICTHILRCKGRVHTKAVGLCASAGSLIWSAGHVCTIEPTAVLMWHMSSHLDQGNSLSIGMEAILQVEYVKSVLLAASARKGHITKEEVEQICTNPNYEQYITYEEMSQRLQKTVTTQE